MCEYPYEANELLVTFDSQLFTLTLLRNRAVLATFSSKLPTVGHVSKIFTQQPQLIYVDGPYLQNPSPLFSAAGTVLAGLTVMKATARCSITQKLVLKKCHMRNQTPALEHRKAR